MIHVYGTSHVSKQSIKLIEDKIDEKDPDIVALELDKLRLHSLLSDTERNGGPLFLKLIKKFQDHIGSKTGVMPGEEMKYAYQKSVQDNREVYLIDQDIRLTMKKIQEIPRREKVKAGFSLISSFFIGQRFNLSKIPEEEVIEQMIEQFKDQLPYLYEILLVERNYIMAESLRKIQMKNPDSTIVAFVGAAHKKGIEEQLQNQ